MSSISRRGVLPNVGYKSPVIVATEAEITLFGPQTIASVVLAPGDRVLVKDQVDTTKNGIYNVQAGTWTRAVDFDDRDDVVNGVQVLNNNNRNVYSANFVAPFIPDTTPITFSTSGGIQAVVWGDITGLIAGQTDLQAALDAKATTVALAATDAAVLANTNAIALNTAKVSNANHTGDAAGATALTLQAAAITAKTALTAGLEGTDELLVSDAGVLKRMDSVVLKNYVTSSANSWTGIQTFSSEVKVTSYNENAAEYLVTTGTITLDTSAATYFYPNQDFGVEVITFAFSNPVASGRVTSFVMELLGADGATITWPLSVEWAGGNEPGWGAGKDVVSFITRDGGTSWMGFLGGQALS